jgi:hypothetical protein
MHVGNDDIRSDVIELLKGRLSMFSRIDLIAFLTNDLS